MYKIILAVLNLAMGMLYLAVILQNDLPTGKVLIGLGFVALAVATGFQLLKGDK